jgi:hypothetical protein
VLDAAGGRGATRVRWAGVGLNPTGEVVFKEAQMIAIDGLLACWLIGLAGYWFLGTLSWLILTWIGWQPPKDYDWDFGSYVAYGFCVLLWPIFIPMALKYDRRFP